MIAFNAPEPDRCDFCEERERRTCVVSPEGEADEDGVFLLRRACWRCLHLIADTLERQDRVPS